MAIIVSAHPRHPNIDSLIPVGLMDTVLFPGLPTVQFFQFLTAPSISRKAWERGYIVSSTVVYFMIRVSSWQDSVRCITNLSFLRLRERNRLARPGLTCQHHRSHLSWGMTSRLSRCVPPWTPPATTRLTTPRKLPDTSRHVHLTPCSSVLLVSSQVGVESSSLHWSQFCFSSLPRWDVWWVGQQTSTLAESLGDGRSKRWWRSCLLVKSSGGTSWHTSKKPTSWIWISSATKVTGS